MRITAKEKELVTVGISVAAGCKPCTDYHLKAARKVGASDSKIEHTVFLVSKGVYPLLNWLCP